MPTRRPPERERRRVWPWILALMLGALALLAGCVVTAVVLSRAPVGAANDFIALVDDGDYEAAYNALCPETRASLTLEQFVDDLAVDGEITAYMLSPSTSAIGNTSRISGTIKIDDNARHVTFRMRKQGGIWRVCAYDPLR